MKSKIIRNVILFRHFFCYGQFCKILTIIILKLKPLRRRVRYNIICYDQVCEPLNIFRLQKALVTRSLQTHLHFGIKCLCPTSEPATKVNPQKSSNT